MAHGEPDMALYLFADSMINNKPIDVYNNGQMLRDFTYVDDVIESIYKLLTKSPVKNQDFDLSQMAP